MRRMDLYVVEADGSRLQRIRDGVPEHQFDGLYFGVYADVTAKNSRVVYSTCRHPTIPTADPYYGTLWDGSRDPTRHDYEIEISSIDGTAPERLTDNMAFDHYPVWSPDGSRIAFISDRDIPEDEVSYYYTYTATRGGLYTMAPDGSEVREITPSLGNRVALHPPAWSPDGQRIAFVVHEGSLPLRHYDYRPRKIDEPWSIYTVRPDGSDLKKVSDTLSAPSWSPDSQRIAFANPHGDGIALFTMAADGSDTRFVASIPSQRDHIPESTPWVKTISWSPEGSKILFTCATVCVVDTRGSPIGEAPHILSLWDSSVPAWSPDGSRIAVRGAIGNRQRSGHVILYTMDSDGTNVKALVRSGRSMVAEGSEWKDIARGFESCSEGFVVAGPDKNSDLVKDCETLIGLRDDLAGDVILDWGPGIPIDQWAGITVDGSPPRVTRLDLAVQDTYKYGYRRMNGTISAELSRLGGLQVLDLSQNLLSGQIPSELGRLSHLQNLVLSYNQLEGEIPSELGALSKLERLDLKWNILRGSIPEDVCGLSNLRELHLNGNMVNRSIPTELDGLPHLGELFLGWDTSRGCIPPALRDIFNSLQLQYSGESTTSGTTTR